MDLSFLAQYGYWGLFLACFLSSTILPFSSEAVLMAVAMTTNISAPTCLLVATIGNTLGGLTCYALGRLGKMDLISRYFKIDIKKLHHWELKLKKMGTPLTFFSFLPVVGDIIAIAAGFLRTPIPATVILMTSGRLLRYATVLYAEDLIKTTFF